jgi:hypothetical protein
MGYDSQLEGHREFAVFLAVYEAKSGACQKVALKMQPWTTKTSTEQHHLGRAQTISRSMCGSGVARRVRIV